MNIKSLLLGSAAALIAVSGARAADAVVVAEPEPVEYVRVCDTYGAGFFYIPGTETCMRISGLLRYDVDWNNAPDVVYAGTEDFDLGFGFIEVFPIVGGPDGIAVVVVRDPEDDTPDLVVGGLDEGWAKAATVRVHLDVRSETEFGTFRRFVRLEGSTPSGSNGSDVFVAFAYIELGGLLVGQYDTLYDGEMSPEFDVGGGSVAHQIRYTFAAGNGITAQISLEEQDYNYDYTPNVIGKVMIEQAWGSAAGFAAYDATTEEFGLKALAAFKVTDAITLEAMATYEAVRATSASFPAGRATSPRRWLTSRRRAAAGRRRSAATNTRWPRPFRSRPRRSWASSSAASISAAPTSTAPTTTPSAARWTTPWSRTCCCAARSATMAVTARTSGTARSASNPRSDLTIRDTSDPAGNRRVFSFVRTLWEGRFPLQTCMVWSLSKRQSIRGRMRDRPLPTPLVRALAPTIPFVGPEALVRASGKPFRARIGANESGFGPSPSVIAAMAEAARDMWKYGDPENFDLRAALAAHCGVGVDNVLIGEGVDGLLGLCVRMFTQPADPVVTSLGGYPTFNYHVAGFGARLVSVPYEDDRESLNGLLEAARREMPPLAYLANPDNPMGSWWDAAEVTRFIEALPPATMLLLDEAYSETAPASAFPPLDVTRPNVIRLRTFSKAYGLAGLRCGYAIGEASVIREFEKIRAHFGVNHMALTAAMAALADQDYLRDVVAKVDAGRRRLARIADDNGLRALPSATNFVAIDCGADGVFAKAVLDRLLERGIFIRKPMTPGLDRCIRVSVGLDHELDMFAAELPLALAAVRSR